jgi:hypothetical protein
MNVPDVGIRFPIGHRHRHIGLDRQIATIVLKGVRTRASRSLRDSHRKYLTCDKIRTGRNS